MNAPSPADRVEAALTPPWGPRLDHFLAARDEMKRPAPAQAPDTFRQEYVFQGDWHPDSEGFLAPDPNGPRPEDPVGMCTCSDLPAVMEAEVLPPAEAGSAGATPAAALVPASRPIRRLAVGPGHLAFIPTDPALLHHPAEILQEEARIHRNPVPPPVIAPEDVPAVTREMGRIADQLQEVRLRHFVAGEGKTFPRIQVDSPPGGPAEILQADFAEAEIRIAAGLVSEAEARATQEPGPVVFIHSRPGGKSFFDAMARLHRHGQADPILVAHRGSSKEETDAEAVQEYVRVAREEVIPLVTSPEGAALAEALQGSSKAFARLEVLLGALGKSAGQCIDDFLLFRDEFPWDPKLCAAPEYPDLPQKGRSPKAYHHQFQPGEGRHGTAPSRTTRDAARAARKAKKKGRR